MKNKNLLLKFIIITVILIISLLFYNREKLINIIKTTGQIAAVKNLNRTETIDIGKGVNMEFVLINPGTFTMGSSLQTGDGDEGPEHKVTITKPYYMGKYEVTEEQWEALMGSNPGHFIGEKNPVDNVSYKDCEIFLDKLSQKTGHKFVLPTEAQWEFACRAGTNTRWSFGDNESLLEKYAWYQDNSNKTTHPVGEKQPNPYGLYDMYGNVQEWCADWYANPYEKADAKDPLGPNSGASKVLRGGAWGDDISMIRSSYRNCNGAEGKTPGIGFRCAMLSD